MPKSPEKRRFQAAAVQMTSTDDVTENLRTAERLVRRAAGRGAGLISLPENFAHMRTEGTPATHVETLDGELVGRFGALARELGIHLALGSFAERIPRSRRVYNTGVLLGPRGRVLAVYRKHHLFDIHIRGGVDLQESRTVKPGDGPVVARTSLGKVGLSICYDLRFPEFFRHQTLDGAQILLVPAAFTAYTGPHHWLPLLRARAIENQCWVIAAAQVGQHNPRRASHGESVIIDPWGKVVARKLRGVGVIDAQIDLDESDRVRRGMPCLDHVHPELLGRRSRSRRGLERGRRDR